MTNESHVTLTDRKVIDDHFETIGTVTDVLYDADETTEPRWAVVKTGVFGGEHPTPLDGSYVAESGDLVVPFDRATVKNAPKIPHDHVLTREVEEEIAQYYEVTE